MELQQSIFDQTFNDQQFIRRRSLLAPFLRIYTWVLLAIVSIILIVTLISLIDLVEGLSYGNKVELGMTGYVNWMLLVSGISGVIGIALVFFLPPLLVWLERKWAIRYNWCAGGCWTILCILGIALNGLGAWLSIIPLLIFAPYWALLYNIRRDWEENAVSGKQLKR